MVMTTKFKLTEDRRHYVPFSDGRGGVHYSEPRLGATWEFPNATVTLHTETDKYVQSGRTSYSKSVKAQHSRCYVATSDSFNVLEDLENRQRRPHQVWKPLVLDVLKRIGVEPDQVNWNQRAGCTCGCSPGFILRGRHLTGKVTFSVTLKGVPTVDETKPARELVGTL